MQGMAAAAEKVPFLGHAGNIEPHGAKNQREVAFAGAQMQDELKEGWHDVVHASTKGLLEKDHRAPNMEANRKLLDNNWREGEAQDSPERLTCQSRAEV